MIDEFPEKSGSKGKRGQIPPRILIAMGLITAIIVAFSFAIGGIQNFFKFLIENFFMVFLVLFIGGGIAIAIIDSIQEKPNWRLDFGALGLVVGIFLFLSFLPTITGAISGYTADLKVKLFNPIRKPVEINSLEVSNFKKATPFTIISPPSNVMAGLFQDTVSVSSTVTCNGKVVDQKTFTMVVWEGRPSTRTTKIHNLPAGASCSVKVTVPRDSMTRTFSVP